MILLTPPGSAIEPRVLFASRDNIQRELQHSIDRAVFSIDGAVFHLSSPSLWSALERAAKRGVTVRLITDGRRNGKRRPSPFAPGLEMRRIAGRRGHGAMHHKFAIFDGAEVVTGSYNWTPGAQFTNHENVLFEQDPEVVGAYRRQFEQLWLESRRPFRTDNETSWENHTESN